MFYCFIQIYPHKTQKMPARIEIKLRRGALKEVSHSPVWRICVYTFMDVYIDTMYYCYYCVRSSFIAPSRGIDLVGKKR